MVARKYEIYFDLFSTEYIPLSMRFKSHISKQPCNIHVYFTNIHKKKI